MKSSGASHRMSFFAGLWLLVVMIFGVTGQAESLGTAFTYQGRLTVDGRPADGAFDLRFGLYAEASGGAEQAAIEVAGQTVTNGLFTVLLDFGDVFDGEAFYLAVGVRAAGGGGTYTSLEPRQPLSAAPYALHALAAPWSGLAGVPAGFADGVDDDTGYAAGTGLTLAGTTFSVSFGGGGAAGTAARSDHDHAGTYSPAAHTHPGGDITSAVATANTALSASWSGLTGVPAGFADGADNDTTYSAGTGLSLAGTTFNVNFGGSGAAGSASRSDHNHNTAYWGLAGNAGTIPGTHFLGTTDNSSLYLKVNGTVALRLLPTVGAPILIGGSISNQVDTGTVGAYIGGGSGNEIGTGGDYAVIGGGRDNSTSNQHSTVGGGFENTADDQYATVGGGRTNKASGYSDFVGGGYFNNVDGGYSTVGGGQGNTVSSGTATIGGGMGNTASNSRTTIGGGVVNTASGLSATISGGDTNTASGENTAVGGGFLNEVSGEAAVIAGGERNIASGEYSTVPGGTLNEAAGDYSFAAGLRAKANHDGSFVLTDSTDADFASVRADALRARFNGGLTFQVNDGYWFRIWYASNRLLEASNGAHLTAGGAWTNSSRRALKENFAPVDGDAVLEQVASLPVQRWNYIAEGPEVTHVGPTAEDFQAAFGLGAGDGIATVDADGVSLAAIQALLARQERLLAKIQALEDRLESVEGENAALARRLSGLEGGPERKTPR